MNRIDQINDDTKVEVFNDFHSSVSYKLDRIERTWDLKEVKKIKVSELYEAVNKKGGRFLFEQNILLIKDSAIRDVLGLQPLDKYSLSQDKIATLLKDAPLKELEDVLMYCSETTLSKVVQKAIDLPISDMTKANLIQSYSGMDIISIIKEREDTEIDKSTTEDGDETPVRRKRVIKD